MKKDNKHLGLEERKAIADGLRNGMTATEIADAVGCSKSTVSREVRAHYTVERKGAYGRSFNDCRNRTGCPVSSFCIDCHSPGKDSCAYCRRICCTEKCRSYEKRRCGRLERYPYTCNGCNERTRCILEKHIYSPLDAQDEYRSLLSSSRMVIHASEEQMAQMQKTLRKGMDRGHSICHIYSYAGDEMPVGERTAYNYINSGYFSEVIRLDQPKAVRYSRRKERKLRQGDKDRTYLIGRTYADFLLATHGGDQPSIVEMDCVEGSRGGNGKVLLTLLFRSCSLQLAFVLESQTSENVAEAMAGLRHRIGDDLFSELFPVILTDRGHEFQDPESIETAEDGRLVSSIFYCSPNSPEEKPFCERNHSEIRRIFRKGTDINFDQTACDRMMNCINSYARPQFHKRSAYDMFLFLYGREAAEALGLIRIPPQEVDMTPECLKTTAN